MARKTKFCRHTISLAVCGTLVLGMTQCVNAISLPGSNDALLLAAVDSNSANSKSSANTPASTASATTGNTNSPADQVKELKTEQTQLRRMSEAIKRTQRAAMDIIGECTQPLEMMGEIDIIGQDVIPIMPATSEGFGNSYSAPRPKYIKMHLAQLGAIIPILQDEIDNIVIPVAEKDSAAQPMQDMSGYMGDIRQHFQKLSSLSQSGNYDQVSLTNEARGIDASCRAINSARNKLLHEEKKVEHAEEKLERSETKK